MESNQNKNVFKNRTAMLNVFITYHFCGPLILFTGIEIHRVLRAQNILAMLFEPVVPVEELFRVRACAMLMKS